MKIYKAKNVYIFLFIIIFLVLCFCLFSCKSENNNPAPDGVAAKVNGKEILEQSVTDRVAKFRRINNLLDDKNWKESLSNKDMTPESYRNQILDTLIDLDIYNDLAVKFNIVPSDQDIENQILYEKLGYASEQDFLNKILSLYSNFDEYKQDKKDDLLVQVVKRKLAEESVLTQDVINKFFLSNNKNFNGSHGYLQLEFSAKDKELAQDYYNKISNGSLSFESAVEKLSKEDKNMLNFNYVLYDCLVKNPDPVKQAINNLSLNQISNLIEANGYIYIIKLVDTVKCDDNIFSFEQLPDNLKENLKLYIRDYYADNLAKDEFDKIKNDYDIVKFDPPKDLPYF